MAFPPSPGQEPRSPLPAPYEDPWRRLSNDLVAVVSAAGLKARELWRLNGQGSLATPAFWHRSLAPLFWPSLLAFGLALLVALTFALPRWWSGRPVEAGAQCSEAVSPGGLERRESSRVEGPPSASPSPGALQIEDPRAAGDAHAVPLSTSEDRLEDTGSAGGTLAPPGSTDRGAGAPSRTMGGESFPLGSGDGAGAESAVDTAAENVALPPPSPLAELVGADPPAWMLELEERPAEGLLRLRLAEGYGALPLAERRSLAEQWLTRTRELGYERLELVDPAGRTLGRSAQVGSGMILLDALSTPP